MYEMYPDAWMVADDRQQQTAAKQPRRRPRKEHSVVPAVLLAPVTVAKGASAN